MRRKYTAPILALVMLLVVFNGCGDKERTKSSSRTESVASGQRKQIDIDFSKSSFPETIKLATGFANPEEWGRWTDGDKAVLVFNRPLPKQFTCRIVVYSAFGPNASAPIKLKIGDLERTFLVSKVNESIAIPVSVSQEANSIEIIPPKPSSPKSLGTSNDGRRLGIAIAKLSIIPSS